MPLEAAYRPRPDLNDTQFGPHWNGLCDQNLLFQQCEACATLRWPPSPVCHNCLSGAYHWKSCEAEGEIWSVAVYEHAYHPGFASQIPYAVALITLDCGIRYTARIKTTNPQAAAPSQRVRGIFVEPEPGLFLLEFVIQQQG